MIMMITFKFVSTSKKDLALCNVRALLGQLHFMKILTLTTHILVVNGRGLCTTCDVIDLNVTRHS